MTTLTSTGAVNLTSSTNWSPAQIPAPGDDLVVGAHTLTLDADFEGVNALGSVTFNHSSASRLAISGTTRNVDATNGWTISGASIGVGFCTTAIASGMTVTLRGKWYLAGSPNLGLFTGTGGNLKLATIGESQSSELVAVTLSASGFAMVSALSGGLFETVGLIDVSGSTIGRTFVTASGGEWRHRSAGINRYGPGNDEFASLTGTAKLDWHGSLESGCTVTGSATFYFASSAVDSVIGQAGDTFVASGSTSSASFTSFIMQSGSGTVTLNGKWCTKNRALTIAQGTGTVRFVNQSLTLAADEKFTVYQYGGSLDLSGLEVANSGKICILELGGGTLTATDTLITNQSTAAQAASNSSALDGKIITLESDPPTLPDEEDVAAGTTYGYSESLLTGTGLIVDPAILSAAIAPSFTEIKGAGWSASTDTLEKIRDAFGGITIDNEAIADAVRTELATELSRIDATITSRATPADVSEHAVAVSITPLKGQQEQRVIDSDLVGYINDRSSIGTIAVTEDDEVTPVDVSAFSSNARIWIEPSSGTGTRYEVTPTVSGDDGNLISFTLPAAVVAVKSTWLWSLRDITGASAGEGRHVIGGTLTIKRAARAPA